MPIITQIVCDGCGAIKKQTNHWFAVALADGGVIVRPLDAALRGQRAIEKNSEQYYCGQKCAVKSIAQWMDGPPAAAVLERTLGV